MDGHCLRCDRPYTLSEAESARLLRFYAEHAAEPPTEVFGICPQCWYGGPAEPMVPLPCAEKKIRAAPDFSAKFHADMDRQLREQLELATAGKLNRAGAMQAVADARCSVSATHAAFLRELNAVLVAGAAIGSSVSAAQDEFLQELNAVLTAEAAIKLYGSSLTKSEAKTAVNGEPI
jgi:hypothetical protein